MKLTEKQKRFADEYVINGGNATQAAIKAGYSKRTSRSIGKENLTKPYILDYIDTKLKPAEKRRNFGVEQAVEKLINLIEGKPLINRSRQINNLNGEIIKDVTYEYSADFEQTIKAIELYLKYKGAFVDKKEVDIKSITFVDDVPLDDHD